MEQAKLYSTMIGVTQEAWPSLIKWDDTTYSFYDMDGCGYPSNDLIESAFIGNMVKFLVENNGGHWVAAAIMPNGDYAVHPHMGKHIPPGQHNAESIIEALAEACKALQKQLKQ